MTGQFVSITRGNPAIDPVTGDVFDKRSLEPIGNLLDKD